MQVMMETSFPHILLLTSLCLSILAEPTLASDLSTGHATFRPADGAAHLPRMPSVCLDSTRQDLPEPTSLTSRPGSPDLLGPKAVVAAESFDHFCLPWEVAYLPLRGED